MQRQNRSEFAAGYGLPLVGPQLLIQEPESQRAALNSRPKLKPQTPPALAYCGQKMVLTKGSTLVIVSPPAIAACFVHDANGCSCHHAFEDGHLKTVNRNVPALPLDVFA